MSCIRSLVPNLLRNGNTSIQVHGLRHAQRAGAPRDASRNFQLLVWGAALCGGALTAPTRAACARSSGSDTPDPNEWRSRLFPGAPARGDGGRKKSLDSDDGEDAVTALIDRYSDQIGQIGFGGVLGACSGYAVKKVGKVAAFVIGTGFVAAQLANHFGYVNISWAQVKDKAVQAIDQDGSGVFDKEDAKMLWKKARKVLKANLPAGGSFGAGFALGFYLG
eukprot:TRINITY_DN940_c0_g1_i2.p1 TRINITY_DN940_c0_g1~~TRINITY_DN940_c0_g1_i2.p1  ORF type:complete len:221 (-),score=47.62 TRINITY_DN940_c0_g1_i2:440-1102(-)